MNADESNSRAERVNEAIAEYLKAVEAGRTPEANAFLAARSDVSAELQVFLSDRKRFEKFVSPLGVVLAPEKTIDREAPTMPPSESAGEIAPLGKVRYFGDYELLEEIGRGGMGVV